MIEQKEVKAESLEQEVKTEIQEPSEVTKEMNLSDIAQLKSFNISTEGQTDEEKNIITQHEEQKSNGNLLMESHMNTDGEGKNIKRQHEEQKGDGNLLLEGHMNADGEAKSPGLINHDFPQESLGKKTAKEERDAENLEAQG